MGLFDFITRIFGGGGGSSQNRGYSRIVNWVKTRHGQQFNDGMTDVEAKLHLEMVLENEIKRGVTEKTLKGFRRYIENQDYNGLVKKSEIGGIQ